MMQNKSELLMKSLVFASLALLIICISIPARAASVDTSSSPIIAQTDTPETLDKQMGGEKVSGPVRQIAEPKQIEVPEPEQKQLDTAQPVLAAMSGKNPDAIVGEKQEKIEKRANHLFALAVASAILGLLCIGAMVAVRKGPQNPPPPRRRK